MRMHGPHVSADIASCLLALLCLRPTTSGPPDPGHRIRFVAHGPLRSVGNANGSDPPRSSASSAGCRISPGNRLPLWNGVRTLASYFPHIPLSLPSKLANYAPRKRHLGMHARLPIFILKTVLLFYVPRNRTADGNLIVVDANLAGEL